LSAWQRVPAAGRRPENGTDHTCGVGSAESHRVTNMLALDSVVGQPTNGRTNGRE